MTASAPAWEATISTALRDTQWMTLGPENMPGLHATLEGKPESGQGDLAIEANERLFIFELKGAQSEISTEWNKTVQVKQPGGGILRELRPKVIHTAMLEMANRWARTAVKDTTARVPDPSALPQIMRCLRVHHFVYWNDAARIASDAMSGLVLEPYLMGTIRRLLELKARPPLEDADWLPFKEMVKLVHARFSLERWRIDHLAEAHRYRVSALPIADIYRTVARIRHVSEDSETAPKLLGLRLDEFREYIRNLAEFTHIGNDTMNAVVLGTNGFFRSVARLSELNSVLEKLPRMNQTSQVRRTKPISLG